MLSQGSPIIKIPAASEEETAVIPREGEQMMNLGFVVLYVDDMEKVKAFYTELLGMTVLEQVSGPNFLALRPDGGSLVALQNKAVARFPPAQETQSGSVELSFEVADVDGAWQHWKDQGVEIVSDPVDLPFGRYFMAKDPEGHYLSVYRFAQQPAIPAGSAGQAG
jgi:predicted enzyme related to lactoylglutathione lyase